VNNGNPSEIDRKRRHIFYAKETSGLLLVVFLLLVLTVIRYWHAIPWSKR
jgi:hypothetical protein